MEIKTLHVALSCLLAILATKAHTAPLNYDESIGGDLNNQTLLLDAGVNTITGEWTAIFPQTVDRDPFRFTVPTNTQLTGVAYSFDDSGVSLSPGGSLVTRFIISSDPGTLVIPGTQSPQSYFNATLPLTEGTYQLTQTVPQFGFPTATGDGGAIPYTWSFTVESTAVPVPAALWLFATGLIGLVGIARSNNDA